MTKKPRSAPSAEPRAEEYALQVQEDQALVLLDEAEQAIQKASTIQEAKEFADQARAAQAFAKRMKKGPVVIAKAIGYQLRAERRMGEILKEMRDSGERTMGGRPGENESDDRIRLSDLGVTPNESSRAQQLAQLPAQEFEECIKCAQERLTVQAALKLMEEKQQQDSQREEGLAALLAFKIALTHLKNVTSDFFDEGEITYGEAVRLIQGSAGFDEKITKVVEATPWAEVDTLLMTTVRKAIQSE